MAQKSIAPDYNEAEVLRLLSEGSEQAFTEIYNRYSPEVYRRALYFLKSASHAKDIKQEIFLKLWLRRKEFQNVEKLRHYILTMTQNLVLDNLKEISKEWELMKEYPAEIKKEIRDASLNEVKWEDYDKIIQTADRLPNRRREIFYMAKVEGLSYKAIAVKLNISPITVKNSLVKALTYIRQNLLTIFICLATASSVKLSLF